MKQHLSLSLLLSLLFTSVLKAQDWHLVGNSDATTSSKLGTTNTIPVRFFTKNLERMRLDTQGRFGIGTTVPQALLDVNNTAGNQVARFNSTLPKMYIGISKSGTLKGYIGSFSGGVNDIDFGTASGNTTGNTYIVTQSVPRLTVNPIGNVGIGTTSPSYKLHVLGTGLFTNTVYITDGGTFSSNSIANGTALYGSESGSNSYGVRGYGQYAGVLGSGTTIGVYASASLGEGVYATCTNGYGVEATSSNSIGVYGIGATGVFATGTNYGSYGSVTTNTGYYGVYGYVPGSTAGGHTQIGVYGYNINYGYGVEGYCYHGSGVYGSTFDGWAGYFAGNVYTTGSYQSSDKRLKQNINDISNALDVINKLLPKEYEYRQDGNFKLMNLPKGRHYGLIAQDLEQVLPNLVRETQFDPRTSMPSQPLDSTGKMQLSADGQQAEMIDFKAVNYTELIPVLIKAVQEQQQEIAELKQTINKLQSGAGQTTVLSGALEQNVPNPYNNSSTIRYHVPQTAGSAKLLITDERGVLLKAITLSDRGSGQVTFDSGSLAAGVYNYSLWIDNKQVDTKQMVIAK